MPHSAVWCANSRQNTRRQATLELGIEPVNQPEQWLTSLLTNNHKERDRGGGGGGGASEAYGIFGEGIKICAQF